MFIQIQIITDKKESIMEITQHHKDMVRRKQKTFEKKICFATAIPLLQSIDNCIIEILYFTISFEYMTGSLQCSQKAENFYLYNMFRIIITILLCKHFFYCFPNRIFIVFTIKFAYYLVKLIYHLVCQFRFQYFRRPINILNSFFS